MTAGGTGGAELEHTADNKVMLIIFHNHQRELPLNWQQKVWFQKMEFQIFTTGLGPDNWTLLNMRFFWNCQPNVRGQSIFALGSQLDFSQILIVEAQIPHYFHYYLYGIRSHSIPLLANIDPPMIIVGSKTLHDDLPLSVCVRHTTDATYIILLLLYYYYYIIIIIFTLLAPGDTSC